MDGIHVTSYGEILLTDDQFEAAAAQLRGGHELEDGRLDEALVRHGGLDDLPEGLGQEHRQEDVERGHGDAWYQVLGVKERVH